MSALGEFLAAASAEEAALVRQLDALIRMAAPGLQASLKWGNLTYHAEANVCSDVRHKHHLNLQVWNAVGIDDPGGLLSGTGKNMRHIKFKAGLPVERAAVQAIVVQAARLASA